MGAVILPLMGLYLILLVWATFYGVRWAKKRGWVGKKRWLGGVMGFLIIYLPVFWDWIPTVVAHKYYCEKEAGFWVYKTLDEWKEENPGVLENLRQSLQPSKKPSQGDIDVLNDRFAIETHRKRPVPLLVTTISERQLVDTATGDVLVKGVDVGSGVGNMATGGGFKFWLNQKSCISYGFWKYIKQLR